MKTIVICFATIFLMSIGLGQDNSLSNKFFPEFRYFLHDEYKNGFNIDWIRNVKSYRVHDYLFNIKTNIESIKEITDKSYADKRKKNFITTSKNGNYQKVILIFQDWRGEQWVNAFKWTYTYDENGNMTEDLRHSWLGEQWVNFRKYTSTYDENGYRTEEIEQYWVGEQWVNVWKYTSTYDENGNMTEDLRQKWQGEQWVNNHKYTYTYDENGNMTEDLRQYWQGEQWINDWIWTYTYDENGNRSEYLEQDWADEQWVNDWKVNYTYDENGNRSENLRQDWVGEQWVNVRKDSYLYEPAASIQENYIGTQPNEYNLYQNFPNPFNPSTTIEYDLPKSSDVKIEVYNIAGQKIQTLLNKKMAAGSHQVEFNAQNLSSGVYFYRIEAGEYQDVKKMILLK